jgi:multisubunit Na+/H+ antiporter MnhE subunit
MFGRILLAIPLAVLWMLIIDDISAASFALGIVIGLAALAVAGSGTSWIKRGDAIPQGIAIVRFLFSLMRDILLSSVFVARARAVARHAPETRRCCGESGQK